MLPPLIVRPLPLPRRRTRVFYEYCCCDVWRRAVGTKRHLQAAHGLTARAANNALLLALHRYHYHAQPADDAEPEATLQRTCPRCHALASQEEVIQGRCAYCRKLAQWKQEHGLLDATVASSASYAEEGLSMRQELQQMRKRYGAA